MGRCDRATQLEEWNIGMTTTPDLIISIESSHAAPHMGVELYNVKCI